MSKKIWVPEEFVSEINLVNGNILFEKVELKSKFNIPRKDARQKTEVIGRLVLDGPQTATGSLPKGMMVIVDPYAIIEVYILGKTYYKTHWDNVTGYITEGEENE